MDESFDDDAAEQLESTSTLRPAGEPLPSSFLSSDPTPPPVALSRAQNATAARAGHSDAAPLSQHDGGAEPSFSAWSRSLGESLQRQMQQQIEQQVQWQWRQFQAFQAAQQLQQTAMTNVNSDNGIGSFDIGAYHAPNAELSRCPSTVHSVAPSSAPPPPLDPPAYQYEALLPPAYESAEPLAHAPPTYAFSLHERLAARSLAVDEEERVRARAALLERLRPPMPRLASLRAGRFASANASAGSEEASVGNDDADGALGFAANSLSASAEVYASAEARSTPALSAPISPASAGGSGSASRHDPESPSGEGSAFVAAAAAAALQPVVSRRNSDISVNALEPPPRLRELSRAASLLATTTASSSSSSAPAVSSSALAALASLSLMDASPPPSPPLRASSSASISRESLSPLLSPAAVTSASSLPRR